MAKFSLIGDGSPREKAEAFLKCKIDFQLGELMTEASHPKTRQLADWSRNDLAKAIETLKEVDLDALQMLIDKSDLLVGLQKDIQKTLAEGGKVYLSGCGATGRLSLTLEFLWRSLLPGGTDQADRVCSFMAGGDIALIRSIESFEDHFDFGARQLNELGFSENDLLIGVTEGGETSFVIGSVQEAAAKSRRQPYFLYCNPADVLTSLVERSRKVMNDPRIRSISLAVGPMALSGSTRMQASTVLLLAVGACLFEKGEPRKTIGEFRRLVEKTDFGFLHETVVLEEKAYRADQRVIYRTDEYGMTILTDTTERSPTFSLDPFENFNDEAGRHSLCYFSQPAAENAEQAWRLLLKREPRPLNWPEYLKVAGPQRLTGYDFGRQVLEKRLKSTGGRELLDFSITRTSDGDISWKFSGFSYVLPCGDEPLLFQHLLLKVLLNTHSTLLMGRMHRYEGNWMTWVKPSNGKLIDRATRYILGLADRWSLNVSYDQVVQRIFQEIPGLQPDEPIVIKVLNSLQAQGSEQ